MADILDLFPSLAATLPSRREGYAAEPIGRRRQVVPNRRKPRAPIPIPGMLADIRRLLDSELPKINRRLGKISDFAGSLELLAEFSEAIEGMRRRLVAIERHAGVRPPPEVPRHTRRRPM